MRPREAGRALGSAIRRPARESRRWRRRSRSCADSGAPPTGAIVTVPGEALGPRLARFCADRGIVSEHPLLDTVLAGDDEAISRRIASYEAAGATDLMLGFADFPETHMLELFAATMLAR